MEIIVRMVCWLKTTALTAVATQTMSPMWKQSVAVWSWTAATQTRRAETERGRPRKLLHSGVVEQPPSELLHIHTSCSNMETRGWGGRGFEVSLIPRSSSPM